MKAVVEREYGELLSEQRPRVIRSKAEHARALRQIGSLAFRGEHRTSAENELYAVLGVLVAEYEKRIGASTWDVLTPLETLRELMELKGITQSDISRALGDRTASSKILSGARSISKAHAKALATLFEVDAGSFL